ncbi:MAG: exosortase A [Gammaproteobacteria bacterium]
MDSVQDPAAWRRHATAAAVVVAGVGTLYFDTFREMISIWSRSQTFNHCFLILPIAVYLAASKRHLLARMTPDTSLIGAMYLVLNALAWLTGHVLSAAALQHAAVVGLLIGAGWSMFGNAVFRVLLVPFLYLYFAVPFGEFLVPALQDWTATVLVWALRVTGMPVFLEGRYLSIPSGNFVVAEACSGINYLIATLAVGTMYMYLNFAAWWRRVLFMLLAIALPLIANGLRAYGIVMIAHHSDYKYAMGVDHFIYGWVFFGIVIFALFAMSAPFADRTEASDRASAPRTGTRPRRRAQPMRMTGLLLVLLASPHLFAAMSDRRSNAATAVALPQFAGWRGPLEVRFPLGGEFHGATDVSRGRYVDTEGRELVIELAYYRQDGEGAELINQTNRLYDEDAWKRVGELRRGGPAGSAIEVLAELRLRRYDTNENFVVWQWYEANGLRSANAFAIKLAQARARLGLGEPGGLAVTLRTREAEAGAVLDTVARLPALRLDQLAAPAVDVQDAAP